jgi:PTS system mannose-specific IIC component
LKQIVEKAVDFIPFFVGFTLAASLGLNLVSCAVISLIFAVLFYELEMAKHVKATAAAADDFDDDDEEDI